MKTAPIAEVEARRGAEGPHGEAVRAMFDRIAPTYDVLNRVLSAGTDVRWRRRAVGLLDAAPAGEFLDLCAGTLDLSATIEQAHPTRKVVAVDFAADMLARGRHKVLRTETVVADALALPFEDERFAAVICGFGMRNLSDPRRGIAESLRVLAPGGRLVVLEFFRPRQGIEGMFTRAFHAAYARVVLPLAGAVVAADRSAYAYLARSMASFLSRAELEDLLRREGAVDVSGEELTLGVASIVTARKGRRS
jgi:ubiquinone/menaquinone biosynthesis methyltransferase